MNYIKEAGPLVAILTGVAILGTAARWITIYNAFHNYNFTAVQGIRIHIILHYTHLFFQGANCGGFALGKNAEE